MDHVPSRLDVVTRTIKVKTAKVRTERDFRDTILSDWDRKPPPQDCAVRIINLVGLYEARAESLNARAGLDAEAVWRSRRDEEGWGDGEVDKRSCRVRKSIVVRKLTLESLFLELRSAG